MIPQRWIEAYLRFLLRYRGAVTLTVTIITLFFAYAPVHAPPWRSDPGQRPNWVLDLGPAPGPVLPDPP